jgi:hypothetical protein
MDAEGISRACMPMAMGLFVGLQSSWCYRYFRERLGDFDREMVDARLGLINQLALRFGRCRPVGTPDGAICSVPSLESYAPDPAADRRERRWRMAAISSMLVLALCVRAITLFEHDGLPLASSVTDGMRFVLMSFCAACLPAYAVWVDLLHRKPAWVSVIAAALCLSWSIAGLVFPGVRL